MAAGGFNELYMLKTTNMIGFRGRGSVSVLLIFMLVGWLGACKKSNTVFIPGAAASDYYTFLSQSSNGTLVLQSYATIDSQGVSTLTDVEGVYTDTNRNILTGGPMSIGNMTFSDSIVGTQYYYGGIPIQGASYFGTTLLYKLNPVISGQVTGAPLQSNLYAPALININSPSIGSKVNTGTKITWNADPNNTKGILIELKYDPTAKSNLALSTAYPSEITRSATATDNGSYTFKGIDLAGFPAGSSLNLNLSRYNYAKIYSSDSTRKYLITAFTEISTVYSL
jgi:hypothetical protein